MKNEKKSKRAVPSLTGGIPFRFPVIDQPGSVPPVSDPPVPNRAWTEMKLGKDIDALTEEEKRDLYIGHDPVF